MTVSEYPCTTDCDKIMLARNLARTLHAPMLLHFVTFWIRQFYSEAWLESSIRRVYMYIHIYICTCPHTCVHVTRASYLEMKPVVPDWFRTARPALSRLDLSPLAAGEGSERTYRSLTCRPWQPARGHYGHIEVRPIAPSGRPQGTIG